MPKTRIPNEESFLLQDPHTPWPPHRDPKPLSLLDPVDLLLSIDFSSNTTQEQKKQILALYDSASEASKECGLTADEILKTTPELRNRYLSLVASLNATSKSMKTCIFCGAVKKRDRQFHPLEESPDGTMPICIACERNLSYSEEDAEEEALRAQKREYNRYAKARRKREIETYGRILKRSERPEHIAKRIRRQKMADQKAQEKSRKKLEARELRLYGQILDPECREFVELANKKWKEDRGYYMMPHQKREVVTQFMRRVDPHFQLPPYESKPRKSDDTSDAEETAPQDEKPVEAPSWAPDMPDANQKLLPMGDSDQEQEFPQAVLDVLPDDLSEEERLEYAQNIMKNPEMVAMLEEEAAND